MAYVHAECDTRLIMHNIITVRQENKLIDVKYLIHWIPLKKGDDGSVQLSWLVV